MRSFKTMAFALAITTACTAPALAQEDRSNDFNGLYVSGVGGFSAQSNDGGDTAVFDTNRDGSFGDTVSTVGGANAFSPGFCGGYGAGPGATGCKGDQDRAEYWGRVGYDRRMGNFVVGALVEAGRTEARDRTTAFSSTPAAYRFSRGMDYAVAARLRAGYTPNGGILFYATGGGAYAKMDNEFSTTNTANSFTQSGSDDAWGYQAGGGVEALVTRNISIGMEYLYSNFKDDDYFVAVGPGSAGATNPFLLVNSAGTNMRPSDDDFNYHSIRGTVSFRF